MAKKKKVVEEKEAVLDVTPSETKAVLETEDEYKPIEDIGEYCKAQKEAGATHEQTEDEFIKRGIKPEEYGTELDNAFSRKSEDDGKSFLDEGTITKESELTVKQKEDKEKHDIAVEANKQKELAELNKQEEINSSEEDKEPLEKTHALPDIVNDLSPDDKRPVPKKYREKSIDGASTVSFTTWHCPKCNASCESIKGKWICTSPTCLYGKAKPLSNVPEEIERYRLRIPELKANVTKVKMVHVGDGRYAIKEGQEEYIAKQLIKQLQGKTWKQLTGKQIVYLAEWDKTKDV